MYSNKTQWRRIRRRVLVGGESIRSVARKEGMSRITLRKILRHDVPPGYGGGRTHDRIMQHDVAVSASNLSRDDVILRRWTEWLYQVEQGVSSKDLLSSKLSRCTNKARKKILAVMAHQRGFSSNAIAKHLGLSKTTVRHCIAVFDTGGIELLLGRKPRARIAENEAFRHVLFGLLHEPPPLSGFNRTTWRMEDLQKTLAGRGFSVCKAVIREAMRKEGFRWRSAKVVLTSNDPEYRQKLDRVQKVLSNLDDDERFFSIDEFGPFAIKAKPGRVLAGPGANPSVPQWQKSKGWLIVTAALELSRNRVTHFYSRAKNTVEMIRMAETLLEEYRDTKTLYLSWDAASWHVSKRLLTFVETHNAQEDGSPRISLVPLPASAQFLNVIESVFSGMARAIIHNSNYSSIKSASDAIDRYFEERNSYYEKNPKRAGKKIWGKERTEPAFNLVNNCKDPAYR